MVWSTGFLVNAEKSISGKQKDLCMRESKNTTGIYHSPVPRPPNITDQILLSCPTAFICYTQLLLVCSLRHAQHQIKPYDIVHVLSTRRFTQNAGYCLQDCKLNKVAMPQDTNCLCHLNLQLISRF